MIGVLRSVLPDGGYVYQGLVQIDGYDGVPVLIGARCLNGRPREEADHAATDARRHADSSKKHFPPLRGSIALQRSEPPGRMVYSGLVRVDRLGRVPLFERASAPDFHWPTDPDEALARAREKEGTVATE